MGWARGSELLGEVIASIQSHVRDKQVRKAIYTDLINAFEDQDADTLNECVGDDPAFDEAYKEIHPDGDEDEELQD